MKLYNTAGSSVELSIIDYQYPGIQNDRYDSNWLHIRISATHAGRSWNATSPCLLTWEVEALALWLEKLGSGQQTRERLAFNEPVLVFQVIESGDGDRMIRLYFELDSRPEWARSRYAEQEDLWIDFPLSEANISDAVQSLRLQLGQFPKRARHLLARVRFPKV